jgi:hypothetical protein
MHPISKFFEIKTTLEENAKSEGKPCALPSEVLPHLAAALQTAAVNRIHTFNGTCEHLEYLLNAARIMAVFAVWEHDPDWLRSGILALLYENGATDGKLTITHLALLNHASEKIGISFPSLSQVLADQVASDVSPWIISFNARQPEQKCLEAFGFKEVLRGGKFEFKCNW